MNFFENQDSARKKTKVLVFYFLLAILLIIGGINAAIYGMIHYATRHDPVFYEAYDYPIWAYTSVAIIGIILLGTLIKMLLLRGGGLSVAKMVNARPINVNTSDFKEKRFVNLVEEMSLASGVPIPKLFVMDQENAINAFVAGIKPQDTVMVVTRGTLDNLNRAELQSVIGHEFSHIFNSDMRINLRLIGILAGILAIGQLGYFLMRTAGAGSSRRNGGPILLIGVAAFILGYIGLFFGRLIKAAISRQRELLADASAVQYTRYPRALVSAFKKMALHQKGSQLETKQVEDISHLCFGEALNFRALAGLFATHPSLDKRIQAIDPNGQYEMLPPDAADKPEQVEEIPKEKAQTFEKLMVPIMVAAGAAAGATVQPQKIKTSKEAIKQSIGNPSEDHLAYAHYIHQQIPEKLLSLIRDPRHVDKVYFVLAICKFGDNEEIHSKIKDCLSETQYAQVLKVADYLQKKPKNILIPIFDLSLPAFTQCEPDRQKQIYEDFESVVCHLEPSPFRFAMLTILGKKMASGENVTDKPKYHEFEPLMEDISKLFSFILFFDNASENKEKTFHEVLFKLSPSRGEYTEVQSFKPIQFRCILERLNELTPQKKSELISACVDLVMVDNQLSLEEAELIRVIAECLECPMPPILNIES